NLCVNARDAMPQGGTLELNLENVQLDDSQASMVPHAQAGAFVLLRVKDSGVGIPRAILDKIFDPFFTTKEVGKGTGLGLSTVLGIVKSHGGFITVESRPGHGATFNVYLPAHPELVGALPPAPAADSPSGQGEQILVVDDERSVREVTRRVLEHAGYAVQTAADGIEALEIFSHRRAWVKAVLTDVVMPNLDGVALVRVLRKMEPALRIIACSGADGSVDDSGKAAELKALGVQAFLSKPYPMERLLQTLHEVLSR
ncbi:MAG: response regulator, partial [Verrucomicrobia bacterium]|nr:response regulator [Verrucomicrobiota bacterium]